MATPYGVLAGVVLWGLHLGATQGVFAVLIARAAPQDRKATAFGVFNFFSGLAMLASGLMAGMLWQYAGAQASFAGGAFFFCGGVSVGASVCTVLKSAHAKKPFGRPNGFA